MNTQKRPTVSGGALGEGYGIGVAIRFAHELWEWRGIRRRQLRDMAELDVNRSWYCWVDMETGERVGEPFTRDEHIGEAPPPGCEMFGPWYSLGLD